MMGGRRRQLKGGRILPPFSRGKTVMKNVRKLKRSPEFYFKRHGRGVQQNMDHSNRFLSRKPRFPAELKRNPTNRHSSPPPPSCKFSSDDTSSAETYSSSSGAGFKSATSMKMTTTRISTSTPAIEGGVVPSFVISEFYKCDIYRASSSSSSPSSTRDVNELASEISNLNLRVIFLKFYLIFF